MQIILNAINENKGPKDMKRRINKGKREVARIKTQRNTPVLDG